MAKPPVTDNPWQALRQFTAARIALGRAGISQPTAAQLDFQLAHAQARDAVHQTLDATALAARLATLPGLAPALLLHSAAENRATYLQRPDLGRRLDAASRALLGAGAGELYDLAFVIADGLSALAIEQNAVAFLEVLLARLQHDAWTIAPPVIVREGRVALGDEVAQLLGARAVVVLVGERPGLSSPDSMGLYVTWQPRVGLPDSSRNCISNVRPAGLAYADAAHTLHYLLSEARRRGLSGVGLKDETEAAPSRLNAGQPRFLL
ncbi:ethanolamine ammonia-lyase subunit EutC [Massilia sp. S19_KUP03_FR1]|uniref:ethanolamine ammonia-lyase subunit EutC n=1 Tax=Massilia sp. S19_KUP03_FR1 TaxID=3025503 RepID=UPI002FCD9324